MCAMDWSVKVTDVLIVGATIAGPILAVWASEWRQAQKSVRDRKEWVFRTLWSTRSVNLHPDHVSALNQIDFAFPEKDHKEIADAWHLYMQQLNESQGQSQDSIDRWHDKSRSLLADLIHLMASDLGIPFSKSLVTQRSYNPIAYAENEAMRQRLQAAALSVLTGAAPLHIQPHEPSDAKK